MASRRSPVTIGPGQEALPLFPDQLAPLPAVPPQGGAPEQEFVPVAVGIAERAYHLVEALNQLGLISQGQGMLEHAESGFGQKRLQRRYGAGVGGVLERKQHVIDRQTNRAKWSFARATGMHAMIGAGLVSEAEVKTQARGEFEEFWSMFAGPDNADARDAYRKQMRKILKQQTKR